MAEIAVAALAGVGGSAVSGYVGALVGSQFVGALVGAVASAAISSVVGGALGLNKRPKSPAFTSAATDRQQMIRSAVATRQIIYGQAVVSGPIVFATSSGSNNRYLHLVIPLAGHECEAITSVWFGDELVGTLDGSGNVTTGRFAGKMRVKKHLGSAAQTVDTDLDTESTEWTVDHRLRGITYLYVRLEYDATAYPSGLENIKALVKGKKLYDPRTSLTVWSDNWALCMRDYLASEYGLRATAGEIDDDAVITAANLSDESVTTPGGTGTEKRYTCNGTVDTGNTPMSNLRGLLTGGAGKLIYSQGLYVLQGGAFVSPTVVLDEDDLRGTIAVRARTTRQDLFNRVRGTFVSPENFWQPSDFTPVGNSLYETQDGSEQITRDIELPYTITSFAAQRLAKIVLERGRQGIVVNMPCKLTAFKVRAGDYVNLTIAQLGWSSKPFSVNTWRMTPDGGIDLELREEAAATYSWSSGEATVIDPAPDTELPSLINVAPPSSLVLDSGSDQAFVNADGTVIVRIYAQWTPSPDAFVANTEIQYKLSSDTDYTSGFLAFATPSAYIGPVQDGVTYNVRIRAINAAGVPSTWVTGSIAATGKDTPPGDPSSLAAAGVVEGARLTWTNPVDKDLAGIEVWEASANDRATAVLIDTVLARTFDRLGLAGTAVRYYWVRAIDTTGNISGWHPAGATAGVSATAVGAGGVVDYADVTGTKPPADADNTTDAIETGTTVTSGGITFSAGGAIKGGQTAYNTGNGWFLGYSGGFYKFSIGDPGGSYMTWDGSSLTIKGNLVGTTGTFSGDVDYQYISGSILSFDSAPGTDSNSTTTWIKAKGFIIDRSGTVSIRFNLSSNIGGNQARGRIYKNGVAFGTLQSTTSLSYVEFSQTLTFARGDAVDLYLQSPTGAAASNTYLRMYSGNPSSPIET